MKVLAFDCETTDKNPQTCGLITLSGAIVIDSVVTEYFDFKMRPFQDDSITEEALEINKVTRAEIEMYPEPTHVMKKHILPMFDQYVRKFDKKDKFFPFGYNVGFDITVLDSFFRKCGQRYGSGSYQNWASLDLMQSVNVMLFTGTLPDSLPNRKLGTIAKHFNVPIQAHIGLSDIKATLKIAQHITKYAQFSNLDCKVVRRNAISLPNL